MKDYSGKNIFELMAVPANKLKELSIAEFAEKINGKRVNIHPSSENGDLSLSALDVNILVDKDNRICIFGRDSHLHISLSETMVFGIYSYENGKSYRIAFEGNSPDLLLAVVGGRLNDVDEFTSYRKMKESGGISNA